MSGTPEVTGGGETRSFSVWDRAVSIEDKLLTLEFEEPLRSNTSYEVVVPPGLVWDGQNELLEGTRCTFKTIPDGEPPVLVSAEPPELGKEAQIDAVTSKDINELASKMLKGAPSVVVYGDTTCVPRYDLIAKQFA